MNTFKGSKGPWCVADTGSTYAYIDDDFGLNGGRDYFLAEVTHGDPEELKANATLIASAPDLLAALQHMVACHTPDVNGQVGAAEECSDSLSNARQAISKALCG